MTSMHLYWGELRRVCRRSAEMNWKLPAIRLDVRRRKEAIKSAEKYVPGVVSLEER